MLNFACMSKGLQKLLLMLVSIQLLMGSAAWMYSSHFCKYQDDCNVANEISCCSEEMKASATCFTDVIESSIQKPETADCCVTISTYFNFPVYRTNQTESPNPLTKLLIASDFSFDLMGFEFKSFEFITRYFNIKAASPPGNSPEFLGVFRV